MQRGLRAVCTTPSPVRLMASAGQTSAQVGVSQCMQTTGTVWIVCARFTNSRWIIGCPLCVSHSLHAATQDWQPMQRWGSMKKYFSVGLATRPPFLLMRLPMPRVRRRAIGRPDPHGAHLVLRNLGDGILCRDGELVHA